VTEVQPRPPPETPPLPPRRKLGAIELTGGRRSRRETLLYAMMSGSIVALALLYVPSHAFRDDELKRYSDVHSYGADLGALAPIALVAVAALALLVRRRGCGTGIVAGLLAMAVAFFTAIAAAMAHFLSNTHDRDVSSYFFAALAVVFFAGVAEVVLEPLAFVHERRRLERADPVFAAARVVSATRSSPGS
jgi:hypothetical protein